MMDISDHGIVLSDSTMGGECEPVKLGAEDLLYAWKNQGFVLKKDNLES